MIKIFCDVCGEDMTGQASGAKVNSVTKTFHLCQACGPEFDVGVNELVQRMKDARI